MGINLKILGNYFPKVYACMDCVLILRLLLLAKDAAFLSELLRLPAGAPPSPSPSFLDNCPWCQPLLAGGKNFQPPVPSYVK